MDLYSSEYSRFSKSENSRPSKVSPKTKHSLHQHTHKHTHTHTHTQTQTHTHTHTHTPRPTSGDSDSPRPRPGAVPSFPACRKSIRVTPSESHHPSHDTRVTPSESRHPERRDPLRRRHGGGRGRQGLTRIDSERGLGSTRIDSEEAGGRADLDRPDACTGVTQNDSE